MGGLTSAKPVKSGISLVLPAFNEADCIRQAVNEAVEAFERMGVPFEIVVVNDGSKDSTVEIVRDLSSRDQRVRLVERKHRAASDAQRTTGAQGAARATRAQL